MLKSFLSYLYHEKKWKHPINQLAIYAKSAFLPYSEPQQKFIVFAQGRTGSTVLVDLINQLPGVHCDGEIYGASMPRKIWFPKRYLRSLIKLGKSPIYGFRVKVYDLTLHHGFSGEQNRVLLRNYFNSGWKVIYLHRQQKLRQALSSLIAESRDEFHTKSARVKVEPVRVDATSLPYRLNLLNSFGEEEAKCLQGINHFIVSYENDLLNQTMHQPLLDRISEFLGTEKTTVKSKYQRTVRDNLSQQVLNLDEVQSILTSHGMAEYLKEL